MSMFCFGSGVSVPSACSSYSMKTRFQNSRKRSQRVQPGRHFGSPQPSPRPSRSRSPSPDRTARRRRPTRSSPTTAAARSAPAACRSSPQVDRRLVGPELQLRIAGVDAHPHPLPVELQVLVDELGRVLDRAVLEVPAEREVAEHLEERQVARVEPDLVDVGRAEALLAGRRQRRRRLLAAEEERHLRLHARADQQRRPVVRARDQRSRRAAEVPLRLEVGEIALANLGGRTHPLDCRGDLSAAEHDGDGAARELRRRAPDGRTTPPFARRDRSAPRRSVRPRAAPRSRAT